MNLSRFEEAFPRSAGEPGALAVARTGNPDLDWLFDRHGGASFGDGLYRVHSPQAAARWTELASEAFPEFQGRLTVFAQDWQGNQFAWRAGSEPCVLLVQIGSGEAFEVSPSLEAFHEEELVEHPEEALNAGLWIEWREMGGACPNMSECIGFRSPLFLGGENSVDNLVVSDAEVYWSLVGQLLAQVRALPEGTPIESIRWGGGAEQ